MYPNPKPNPPMPGGEYTHISDPGTPPLPAGVKVVQLIPVGDGGPGTLPPPVTRRRKPKPLLPSAEEVAKLPRLAREAFAARCALRVQPLTHRNGSAPPVADAAGETALAILRVSSRPEDVLPIRRDFVRLRRLAKANGWTDETPVAPEVFGPLWPGRVPKWARETNGPRE